MRAVARPNIDGVRISVLYSMCNFRNIAMPHTCYSHRILEVYETLLAYVPYAVRTDVRTIHTGQSTH